MGEGGRTEGEGEEGGEGRAGHLAIRDDGAAGAWEPRIREAHTPALPHTGTPHR